MIQAASQLRHTRLGNAMQPLFEPDRLELTQAVLRGTCGDADFPDTRERLAAWPELSEALSDSLEALERAYDPFDVPSGAGFGVEERRALAFELVDLSSFLGRARRTLSEFDRGLGQVVSGTISIEEVAARYEALLDAYATSQLLPIVHGA